MPPQLRDLKGCLTDVGLQAFKGARPGAAPPELAAHVAGCARCQDRLLTADPDAVGPGKRTAPPPVWRVFALFLGGLVLAVVAFAWMRRVLGL
jgi:hypothetical protein